MTFAGETGRYYFITCECVEKRRFFVNGISEERKSSTVCAVSKTTKTTYSRAWIFWAVEEKKKKTGTKCGQFRVTGCGTAVRTASGRGRYVIDSVTFRRGFSILLLLFSSSSFFVSRASFYRRG